MESQSQLLNFELCTCAQPVCACRKLQQTKDRTSFQLMCKTLKARHCIAKKQVLDEIWEGLENCAKKVTGNYTRWFIRAKGGKQHKHISQFVAEWLASRSKKINSTAEECSSDRYVCCLAPNCLLYCSDMLNVTHAHLHALHSEIHKDASPSLR